MEKYQPDKKFVVMSREEVRSIDRWAIEEIGIPGVVLMENAGRSCAELIAERLAALEKPKVCIFCGTGNNGGDGFVAARHLVNKGFAVTVVLCGDKNKVRGDAKINLDILERLGQSVEQLEPASAQINARVAELASNADIVVDALFGTGLNGRLRDDYIRLIGSINALGKPVIAVDIPSGLDCDTAEVLGASIRAVATVTFVAVKKGFTKPKASEYTGEIFVADIGITPGPGQPR